MLLALQCVGVDWWFPILTSVVYQVIFMVVGALQLPSGEHGGLVVCITDIPSSILGVIAGISAGKQRWALRCSCRAMLLAINLVEASNVKLASECAVFQTTLQRCLSALHVVTGREFFNVMYQDYATDNFQIQFEAFECSELDAWQLQVELYRDLVQQPGLCMFKVLSLAGEYRVTMEAEDANSAFSRNRSQISQGSLGVCSYIRGWLLGRLVWTAQLEPGPIWGGVREWGVYLTVHSSAIGVCPLCMGAIGGAAGLEGQPLFVGGQYTVKWTDIHGRGVVLVVRALPPNNTIVSDM